jgi:hypothetical protein
MTTPATRNQLFTAFIVVYALGSITFGFYQSLKPRRNLAAGSSEANGNQAEAASEDDHLTPADLFGGRSELNDNQTVLMPNQEAPDRPSVLRLVRQRQTRFYHDLLFKRYTTRCSCDECTPKLYFNYPISCGTKHMRSHLEIHPKQRPVLTHQFDHGSYEALQLAQRTIEYFSRPLDQMDDAQAAAFHYFNNPPPGINRSHLLTSLGQDDTRYQANGNLADPNLWILKWAIQCFNDIFFFGALKNIHVEWNTTNLEGNSRLVGGSFRRRLDGKETAVVQLNPTRLLYPKEKYVFGQGMVEERVGTIIHEMLHCFIKQHACSLCAVSAENICKLGHGRAWLRVAKVIEEQSMRLIGVNVDMNIYNSILNNDKGKPSVHDLEVAGFIKPLARHEELGVVEM